MVACRETRLPRNRISKLRKLSEPVKDETRTVHSIVNQININLRSCWMQKFLFNQELIYGTLFKSLSVCVRCTFFVKVVQVKALFQTYPNIKIDDESDSRNPYSKRASIDLLRLLRQKPLWREREGRKRAAPLDLFTYILLCCALP